MVLARRKRKGNISMGKLPPPVGFQIMPASAGGGTNAAAMRPTYAFLPANQDEMNKRIYAAKKEFLTLNQSKSEADFPGMPDLYGQKKEPASTPDNDKYKIGFNKCMNDPQIVLSGLPPKAICEQRWSWYV
jgi:hypothetical protein